MDDQKTVKVDSGQGYQSQGPYGQGPVGAGGGWEATQYAPADQPTPRPGEVPVWGGPPQPSAPAWETPQAAGGQTVIIPSGPKVEPSFAWLVVTTGPAGNRMVGQPLPLRSGGVTTIGRVQGNDIVLPDYSCSGQHAKIRFETEESAQHFVIYDLASSNGLYVGDKEHYKEEASRCYRHVLKDGDYVLVGETTLVFKQV